MGERCQINVLCSVYIREIDEKISPADYIDKRKKRLTENTEKHRFFYFCEHPWNLLEQKSTKISTSAGEKMSPANHADKRRNKNLLSLVKDYGSCQYKKFYKKQH